VAILAVRIGSIYMTGTGRNAVTYTALPTFVSCAMSGFLGRSNGATIVATISTIEHVSDFLRSPFSMAEFLPVRDIVRFCLVNETLEPHDRIRQFLHQTKWLEHLQRHIEGLRKSERENNLS
jgi:hypothetical protein